MNRQDTDIISEREDSPLQFRNPQSNRDSSVASNISMLNEQDEKIRYITAQQDIKGKNVAQVKQWHREGKLLDYKIEGQKSIKISFKNKANVQKAKIILGVKSRYNTRGNGGGGKRGASANDGGII